MSLRDDLPAVQAGSLPRVCAFEPDSASLERWNASVRAEQTPSNTVSILDVIGEDYWTGGGFTSRRMSAALRSIGAENEVHVDINSPGGDFFEGVAIYNMLRAHKGKVTVRVLSLAASAASVIAMAADELLIGEAGFLMIHNAWTVTVGNRLDLEAAIPTLETFDASMATVYAARSGRTEAEAAGWMDAETWFNGTEAIAAGLADGLLEPDAVTEDEQAGAQTSANAVRRIDATLARAGMPRSERRSLLGEVKGGKRDAAATATQDAGDMQAALQSLLTTLKN